MHELSIAQCIVEMVEEVAVEQGVTRVAVINLRLGAMAGVVEAALLFSFEMVATDTVAQGARLAIQVVPLAIRCAPCERTHVLATANFVCPDCGQSSAEIVSGRELEVASIEIER